MSHFSVLVTGPDPELHLKLFWELDLSLEDMKQDDRASFNLILRDEDSEEAYEI